MNGPAVLIVFSLARARTMLLSTGVLLAVFQVLLVAAGNSLESSSAFEQIGALMPAFVRSLLGSSFAGFLSFRGIVCFGYFHPVVMVALVGLSIALATATTSEVESGFADLVLSRSLARHWLITRTVAVAVTASAALLAAMVLGTVVGLSALAPDGAPWPSARLIGSLAVNLGMLMLSWSGVAAAIGAAVRRRTVAMGSTGLAALATFLLDYLARAWRPAESVAWVSPFRYYSPLEMLMGGELQATNLVVLAAIACTGFALAYVFFERRDITR